MSEDKFIFSKEYDKERDKIADFCSKNLEYLFKESPNMVHKKKILENSNRRTMNMNCER